MREGSTKAVEHFNFMSFFLVYKVTNYNTNINKEKKLSPARSSRYWFSDREYWLLVQLTVEVVKTGTSDFFDN